MSPEFEPSIAERLLYILVALARNMNLMASGSHLPNSKSHQGKPRKTSSRSMAPLLTLRHRAQHHFRIQNFQILRYRESGAESGVQKEEGVKELGKHTS